MPASIRVATTAITIRMTRRTMITMITTSRLIIRGRRLAATDIVASCWSRPLRPSKPGSCRHPSAGRGGRRHQRHGGLRPGSPFQNSMLHVSQYCQNMYICVNIYIYIYIYSCIHVCVHMYINLFKHTYGVIKSNWKYLRHYITLERVYGPYT